MIKLNLVEKIKEREKEMRANMIDKETFIKEIEELD